MLKRTITQVNNTVASVPKLIRVAAYARVSSGKEAMLQSLSAQISYYSALIQKSYGWEYSGVYADEALTGTKDNRPQFVKMIQDCCDGKIDMVITKSISRFARNTVTLLTTVRKLKAYGIDVYFEEQNIHSISGDGELMLTILASYAQEESLSASENQKWRIRKGFEDGKLTCCAMLGYRSWKGRLKIIPKEAETVKHIFLLFLEGYGKQAIANKLNEIGELSRLGNQWRADAIGKILRNEKYCGDLLLQKTFRTDHLTKRKKRNNGEMPMYYVQEAHEPIIDRAIFEATQAELDRRAKAVCVPKGSVTVFTSKILCGICGKNYRRKTTPYNVVWCCTTYNTKGKSYCASKQIPESILFEVSAEMLGMDGFNCDDFSERVKLIIALPNNILEYHFTDGQTHKIQWQDRSRSESWTDEMRQQVRKNAERRPGYGKSDNYDTSID